MVIGVGRGRVKISYHNGFNQRYRKSPLERCSYPRNRQADRIVPILDEDVELAKQAGLSFPRSYIF